MPRASLPFMLAAGLSLTAQAPATSPHTTPLAGTWKAVSFSMDGRTVTPDALRNYRIRFTEGGYHITAPPGSYASGSLTGSVKIGSKKSVRTLDLNPTAGVYKGYTYKGIYRIEGDTLRLCYALPSMNRPAAFASKTNTGIAYGVYKRESP